MSVKKDAARGVKWNAVSKLVQQAISFLVFLILARLLTPQSFGLVALAGIYVNFMDFFVTQGFGMAIVQKKDLQKSHLDTAFWICVFSGVVLSLATWFFRGLISSLLGDEGLRLLLPVLSLGFVVHAMSMIQSAYLTRAMKFKGLAVREMIGLAAGGIIGVVMAVMGCGAWSLVGQQLGRGIIGLVVLWKVSNWHPGFSFSGKRLKELLSFSWVVLSGNLVNFFSLRGDQLIIGKVLGTVPLGYYSIARKLTSLMQFGLTSPITMVTLPIISRMQDDLKRVAQSIYKGQELGALFCLPVFVGVLTMAPDVTMLAFGEKWLTAAPIIRIIVISEIIHFFNIFSYPTFMSLGKPTKSLWMISVRALCTIAAALLGLRWGMQGVAWGMVLAAFIVTIFSLGQLSRLIPVTIIGMLFAVRYSALSTAVMAGVIVLLYRAGGDQLSLYVRVPLLTLAGAATYVGVMRLLSRRLFGEGLEAIAMLAGRKPAAASSANV